MISVVPELRSAQLETIMKNNSKHSKTFKNQLIEKFPLKTHKFKHLMYQFTYLIRSWLLRVLCPVSTKSSHKVTGLNWKYWRGYLCTVHLTNQHSSGPWRAWLTTNDILVCFLLVHSIGEQCSHWSICHTMTTLHSSFSCSSVYYQTLRWEDHHFTASPNKIKKSKKSKDQKNQKIKKSKILIVLILWLILELCVFMCLSVRFFPHKNFWIGIIKQSKKSKILILLNIWLILILCVFLLIFPL